MNLQDMLDIPDEFYRRITAAEVVHGDGPPTAYFDHEGFRYVYASVLLRHQSDSGPEPRKLVASAMQWIDRGKPLLWRIRPEVCLEGGGVNMYFRFVQVPTREVFDDICATSRPESAGISGNRMFSSADEVIHWGRVL